MLLLHGYHHREFHEELGIKFKSFMYDRQATILLRHMASHCYDLLPTLMLFSLMKNGADILMSKTEKGTCEMAQWIKVK